MKTVVTGGAVPDRSGVTLLARLRGYGGQLVTQASLTSVAYTVSELVGGTTVGSGTFAVASCVFDSLQVDPQWDKDTAVSPGSDGAWGYNFAATLPASLFAAAALVALASAAAPRRFQCDVAFTPVSGEPFRVVFCWSEAKVYG